MLPCDVRGGVDDRALRAVGGSDGERGDREEDRQAAEPVLDLTRRLAGLEGQLVDA